MNALKKLIVDFLESKGTIVDDSDIIMLGGSSVKIATDHFENINILDLVYASYEDNNITSVKLILDDNGDFFEIDFRK